jgi:hypothetical protein
VPTCPGSEQKLSLRPPEQVRSARAFGTLGDTSSERARAIEWLREIEESAVELAEVGDLLFARGEPSEPALLERYQLYMRVKAALSLPPGLERVTALHAAKIRDEKKH